MKKILLILLSLAFALLIVITLASAPKAHMMGGILNWHARGSGAAAGTSSTFEDHTSATWEDHTNAEFEDHAI